MATLNPVITTSTTTTTVVPEQLKDPETVTNREVPTTTAAENIPMAEAPSVPPQSDWVKQCNLWMDQAGVALGSDRANALYVIDHESDCNPSARNPSSSAGGIPQALPYTKMGCPMDASGAICQLQWMQGYVTARYGGWAGAVTFKKAHGWY